MRQPCNSLSLNFLTVVIKLYHICDKAFRLIWKSFSTFVKNILSDYFSTIFIRSGILLPVSFGLADSFFTFVCISFFE